MGRGGRTCDHFRSGGVVLDGFGRPFRYGKEGFQSGAFVAFGRESLARRIFRRD